MTTKSSYKGDIATSLTARVPKKKEPGGFLRRVLLF